MNPGSRDGISTSPAAMVDIDGAYIEYVWFNRPGGENDRAPEAPIIFLHHGFGCVAEWKNFPGKVAAATGRAALVFSRRGCGGSSPLTEPRDVRFLHDEALNFLPRFLDRLGVDRCRLFGHSDGATIALLFASAMPERTLPSVVEAPHVFGEDMTLKGVVDLAKRFEQDPGFRKRIARYNADPDRAFHAWASAWQLPEFKQWAILDELGALSVPFLILQGRADPYGSMRHAELVRQRALAPPTIVEISDCGHNPHVEAQDQVMGLSAEFLAGGKLRSA